MAIRKENLQCDVGESFFNLGDEKQSNSMALNEWPREAIFTLTPGLHDLPFVTRSIFT